MKLGNRETGGRPPRAGGWSRRRIGTGFALLLLPLAACAPNDVGATKGAGDDEAFRPLAVGDAMPAYAAALVGGAAGDSVRIAGAGGAVAGAPTAGAPSAAASGALTLVNVWATWCTSCREEFADLERLQRDYASRGLRVVAVSVDESGDERVARFARREGVTFTIAHDAEGRVQRLYQTVGVPETYLVSRDGRLLWRHGGALRGGAPEAREAIDRALAAASR